MYRSVLRIALFLMVILALVGCAQPTPVPTAVPPTAVPQAPAPTAVPPTAVPPTAVPPTAVPPTAVPPTAVPPTVAPTAAPSPTPPVRKEGELLLATTTSTENSGLLKVILPDFEKANNVKVAVIAVGSGQAMKLGEDGNADVLLVHSRAAEDAFMAAGHGTRREDVMYNDFVIVGDPSDPAGLKGMTDAAAAFKKMADAKGKFVSRGDKSGTHVKELDVWKKAGIEPKGDWYISSGQGMGAVLTMANEQKAYTLSDRATYLARVKEGTQLVVLVEGDKALFNPYGVITVNPAKNAAIKGELATKFLEWIISVPTQNLIADFGVKDFGASLFVPDSTAYRASKGTATGGGQAQAAAALEVGSVSFSMDDLKAMEVVKVKAQNSKGQEEEYTGVKITDVLKAAKAEGKTITMIADDGFKAQVPIADLTDQCILSFRTNGGLSSVLPGMAKNLQVKGVIEIQVGA